MPRGPSLAARPASGAGDRNLEDRAGGDGLGFEVIPAPQVVDADRVAAGDVDECLARRNDVAQRLAALARGEDRDVRAGRRVVVEVAADPRVDGLGEPRLVRGIAELALLLGV